MAKQRIGVFCSSFDPVHDGHLAAMLHAIETDHLDQVLCVLSPFPGYRPCIADSEDRWRMLVTACSIDERLVPFRAEQAGLGLADILPALRRIHSKSRLIPIPDPVSVPVEWLHQSFARGLAPKEISVPVLEYVTCQGLYDSRIRVPESRCWIGPLFSSLKPRRFAHSMAVAHTARQLALRFGEDALKAEQAGLLHDCAKSIPLPEMQRIALEHHLDADDAFLASGALLHAVVGAWIATHQFGVSDPDVLEAIRYHNTGHPGMSRLAICVALADSIEPTREPYPYLQEARKLAESSLEKAFLLSLERTSAYVQSKGAYLHPRTTDTIEWLKSIIK